jgi:hypothetical protein
MYGAAQSKESRQLEMPILSNRLGYLNEDLQCIRLEQTNHP